MRNIQLKRGDYVRTSSGLVTRVENNRLMETYEARAHKYQVDQHKAHTDYVAMAESKKRVAEVRWSEIRY